MASFQPNPHRRGFMQLAGSTAAALACSCVGVSAQQPAEKGGAIPGAAKSTESKMLGLGADMLQSKSPISVINMYLNGFHFYADDMGRQIEAHHYCHHLNEEFFQCVIYDGNTTDARLIGIEYIVSERIFKSLSEEEKPLWHSHRHETTAGELVMPGIPETVEHTAIGTLVSTYGKTWHTWQIDRNSTLPIGIPQLMMGFTDYGQVKQEMVQSRDKETSGAVGQLASSKPRDKGRLGRPSDPTGRNVSEVRAGLERVDADADPPFARGRPRGLGSNRQTHQFGLPGYWTQHVGMVMRVIEGDPSGSEVAASTLLWSGGSDGCRTGSYDRRSRVTPAEVRSPSSAPMFVARKLLFRPPSGETRGQSNSLFTCRAEG